MADTLDRRAGWYRALTRVQHGAIYALALLLPLTLFVPLGLTLAPEVHPLFVTPGLHLSDLLLVVILLAGALGAASVPRPARATLGLLALVTLGAVTLPFARSPALAFATTASWFLSAALYLTLRQSTVPPQRLTAVLLGGLGLQAVVGLAQVAVQGPLGLPGELAMRAGQPGAAAIVMGARYWLRAYGLTFHPNVLGGFLAVGLLLALPSLSRRGWMIGWWLLWAGLLATVSRSALLAVALTLPTLMGWLAWHRPLLRRPVATAVLGAVLLLGAFIVVEPTLWLTRFVPLLPTTASPTPADPSPLPSTPEELSLVSRGAMNRLALDLIREAPLTGVGAGNFALAMVGRLPPYIPPQFAHNVPLLLAAEVGVGGGLVWLGLAGWGGWQLWHAARRGAVERVAALTAGLALWLIALFDFYPWSLEAGRLLLVVLLALGEEWYKGEVVERG